MSKTWETTISLEKKACSRYYGVSPVSRHLFITKNVKKHEKLQSPLNKWLSQGILSFHLFLDILSYSKVSKNRKTTKSLEFLHLLQFLHNSTKTSAAGARQGTRSVPVISVPSRNEAWEVYPLEMYYPDNPTRLCRPKAGQSLVLIKILMLRSEKLIHQMLPKTMAENLKYGRPTSEMFDSATVLFSEVSFSICCKPHILLRDWRLQRPRADLLPAWTLWDARPDLQNFWRKNWQIRCSQGKETILSYI